MDLKQITEPKGNPLTMYTNPGSQISILTQLVLQSSLFFWGGGEVERNAQNASTLTGTILEKNCSLPVKRHLGTSLLNPVDAAPRERNA